jgi:hypothetical protein
MTALVRLRIQPPIKSGQQWVKLVGLILKLGELLKLLDLIDQNEDLCVVHRVDGVTIIIDKPEAAQLAYPFQSATTSTSQ